MGAAMGRRRQSNIDLPPRMHVKSGAFYYVTSTTPRKWIALGRDLAQARIKWAEIENGAASSSSISRLIDAWLAQPNELAASTMRCYLSIASQLRAVFNDAPVEAIRPHHVAAWLDNHHSKARANLGKALLSNVLDMAVRQGMIDRNPAREISRLEVKARMRYLTDAEFVAIRAEAVPVLRAAMDISFVTGARISDVLAIRVQHWTDDGLLVRQIKTKKLQLFKRTPILEQVIDQAKKIPRPVRSLFLLCTQKGQPYKYSTLLSWWERATAKAGIADAHFHDIRAKAATDGKQEGIDYQALLGHTTKAMSDRYLKLETAQLVEPRGKVL
jgi:integrase